MNKNFVVLPALLTGLAAAAWSQGAVPTKVGILNAAAAIQTTKEGQKAGSDLQAKFGPKKEALDKKQTDIQALQAQLAKGNATMSPEAKAKLQADIDAATKIFNRDTEDAQAELDEQQGQVMQELGNKMMEIVIKYGNDNGYAVVLDVSNQQSPVLWNAAAADITADIIKLYDQKYPGAAAPAPAAATPAARPPAAAPAARPPAPAASPAKK